MNEKDIREALESGKTAAELAEEFSNTLNKVEKERRNSAQQDKIQNAMMKALDTMNETIEVAEDETHWDKDKVYNFCSDIIDAMVDLLSACKEDRKTQNKESGLARIMRDFFSDNFFPF